MEPLPISTFGTICTWQRWINRVEKGLGLGGPGANLHITHVCPVLSLQNRSDEIPNKLQDDLMQTWTVGAAYWPFVLGLNFMYVPLQHRPLVGAAAGSLWNVYNSFQANKSIDIPGDLAILIEEHVVAETEHGAGGKENKCG